MKGEVKFIFQINSASLDFEGITQKEIVMQNSISWWDTSCSQ